MVFLSRYTQPGKQHISPAATALYALQMLQSASYILHMCQQHQPYHAQFGFATDRGTDMAIEVFHVTSHGHVYASLSLPFVHTMCCLYSLSHGLVPDTFLHGVFMTRYQGLHVY